MAARLLIHPAFYRRVRHYRDRIGVQDARPQTAFRFVHAVRDLVPQLLVTLNFQLPAAHFAAPSANTPLGESSSS